MVQCDTYTKYVLEKGKESQKERKKKIEYISDLVCNLYQSYTHTHRNIAPTKEEKIRSALFFIIVISGFCFAVFID